MGLMDIFGGKTVESIGNIVDEVFTSEDERNQAKIQLKKIEAREALSAKKLAETKRLELEETLRLETIEKSNKKHTKPYKKQKVDKEKRNALMKLKRRAKKVGLVTLGTGRPTKTQRSIWLARLERLEGERGIKPPSP